MTSSPRFRSDVTAAVVVGLLGVFVLWLGTGYSFGTLRRIGPGFLPMVVGTLLVLMSAGLVLESLRSPPERADLLLRPFVMIMTGMLAFAALMERAGLVPAIFALVIVSALAEKPFRPVRTLVSALVISAMGVGIFIELLGMPLRAVVW